VLVVDDEEDIREMLGDYLSSFGYRVTTAADGRQMRCALEANPFELVLLDLGLPGEDGLTLARELRSSTDLGIIIVTGRGQPVDRVVGLEIGADDYIAKPFDLRELVARVRSVLRRTRTAGNSPVRDPVDKESVHQLTFDGWLIDLAARSLQDPGGGTVPLTTGEFDLLSVFARNANRVLSRDELMDLIHQREAGPFDRAIDVRVGRLRRKIERDPGHPDMIKSVRGIGYVFTPKVTAP
jgi:two-component system OmpR family response regulator